MYPPHPPAAPTPGPLPQSVGLTCMRSPYAVPVCGGMRTSEHPTAYTDRIQLPHTQTAYTDRIHIHRPHTPLGGRPRDGSGGGSGSSASPQVTCSWPLWSLLVAPGGPPGGSWWLLVAPGRSWWLLVAPGCPYRSALGSSRDHHQADPGCGRPRCCSCTHSPS